MDPGSNPHGPSQMRGTDAIAQTFQPPYPASITIDSLSAQAKKEAHMTSCSSDKIARESARTNSASGIPQTLLFFILKQLETGRPDERLQQDHAQ